MPRCRYCHQEILWFETENGKRMPVDASPEKRVVRFKRGDQTIAKVVDTFTPHFGNCEGYDPKREGRQHPTPGAQKKPVDPDSRAAYAHWNEEAERMYYAEHPEIFGR